MPEDWDKYLVKDEPKANTDEWSQYEVKKNPSSQGGRSTSKPLGIGFPLSQPSPVSGFEQPLVKVTTPSILSPKGKYEYWVDKRANQAVSERLNNYINSYSGSHTYEEATDLEEIKNNPHDQGAIAKDDSSFWGSVKRGATLTASKLAKGALSLGQGASYLYDKAHPLNPVKMTDVLGKIEPKTNFGLDPEFHGSNAVERAIGGLAEFAPSIIAAESTGGASFFLSGVGNADKQVQQLKNQGVEFKHGSDELYTLGSGVINYLLMDKLPINKLFSKLPASLRESVVGKVSIDAIKDLTKSGKSITSEAIAKYAKDNAIKLSDKIKSGGIKFLENYAKTAEDLTALQVGDYALKEASNKLAGDENFKQSPEELEEGIKRVFSEDAPAFSVLGAGIEAVKNPGAMFRRSAYRNQVIDTFKKDGSLENLEQVKNDIATHGEEQGWSPNEIDNSIQTAQTIHEAVKAIPKQFGDTKFNKAVDLITGRKELQDQLGEIKASKDSIDPSISDIPSKEEGLVEAKLEQSNDKLRELATDHKYRYEFDEEKGTYTKKLGEDGKPEEITKDRYDLEQLEKEFKKPREISEEISAPIFSKAEDDLAVLKQVSDKTTKYEASIKRLTEAKNDGKISENDFNAIKTKFDNVITNSEQHEKSNNENVNSEGESRNNQKGNAEESNGQSGDQEKVLNESLIENPSVTGEVQQKSPATTEAPSGEATNEINPKIKSFEPTEAQNLYFEAASRKYGDLDLDAVKSQALANAKESGNEKPNMEDFAHAINQVREGVESGRLDEAIESGESGINHADTSVMREELGLAPYEKITRGHQEIISEADKEMAGGYDINHLLEKLERNELPKDYEQVILNRYLSSLRASIDAFPNTESLANYKRAVELSDKVAGSQLARSLGARGLNKEAVEDNLSNFLLDEAESLGVTELPQSVIDELRGKWDKGEEARKKYEAGYAKAIEDQIAKLAENEVSKIRKAVKNPTRNKTHQEFVSERSEIIKSLRADLIKVVRGGQGALSSIPLAPQLKAIAPHVAKLVRSLVEEGIIKIEDIVKSIHSDLKDVIDGIEEKDIRDIIGGRYNEPKRNKNEIADAIRDLGIQARLITKIEDLENRIPKIKNTSTSSMTKEVESLREKLKDVEGRLKEEDKLSQTPEEINERRLDKKKDFLKKRIEELKKSLFEGKYEKTTPALPDLKLDAETHKYLDEYVSFQKETALRRDKAAYDRLGKWEKGWDKVQQALGLKRLIQTSIDFSMPFRQAVAVTLNPRHIKTTAKSFKNMFVTTFSPKKYDRLMYAIKNSADYKEMVSDGIHFNEIESKDNLKRDEEFRTSFIYKIPYLREPLMASNRAAASFINTARYELYQKGKRNLIEQGYTRENAPKEYKELAKWTNNITGRGNLLEALEKSHGAQKILGDTFYGARLMASRFNLLNPAYYAKMPKIQRINALKDIASFTSTIMVTLLAAQAAGATVSYDPDDADFLKIKVGDKRYDITGGKAQYIRTYMRILKAVYERATPNSTKKEADKVAKYAMFSAQNFLRYKLAPNTSYGYSAFTGKDPLGRDFDPKEILKIYPMYVDDLREAAKQDGGVSGMSVLIPSLFGIGVQNYPSKKKTTKEY